MGDQKPFLSKSVDALSQLEEQRRPFRIRRLESVCLFISSSLTADSEQGPTKPLLEKTEAGGTGTVHPHLNGSLLIPQQLEKNVKERPLLHVANSKVRGLLIGVTGG